jgi:hypothetical protein
LVLATALSGVAGCGGSSDAVTDPDDGPYGSYALSQVDGTALPVQVHNGPFLDRTNVRLYNRFIVRVTGGEIELDDDGQLYISVQATADADGTPGRFDNEYEVPYKLIDNRLTVIIDGQKVEIGRLEDGALTIGMDLMQKGVVNQFTFRR